MKKFKLLLTSPFVAMAATAPVITLTSCGSTGFSAETKDYTLKQVGVDVRTFTTTKAVELSLGSKNQVTTTNKDDLKAYTFKAELINISGATLTSQEPYVFSPTGVTQESLGSGKYTLTGANGTITFHCQDAPTASFTIKCDIKIQMLKDGSKVVESTVTGFKFTLTK